ncbi:MAG: flagellin [Chloroflexota bacterium]|jgi:flagellin|nr:flagellin [Chloroflexota bacterium]NCA13756.1 flagellin [Pseudomonadota bacterium]
MALRINYNFESVSAQRSLGQTQQSFMRAIEQLSSGLRINKASDDSAGLAVSEKLKNQVRGLNQAQRNAQDSVSMLQVAEGALNETHGLLSRLRELAVQAANDTLTASDRLHIQAESNQLLAEIDRIAAATQFNGITLIGGTGVATGLTFHVGANSDTPAGSNELTFSLQSASTGGLTTGNVMMSALGATSTGQLSSFSFQTSANAAISVLDTAIETISTRRGAIGAMQNRLASEINSLGVASENTGAANSRIRDADVAQAVSEMVRNQILQQSTMAVLAQANQAPQMALQLLK